MLRPSPHPFTTAELQHLNNLLTERGGLNIFQTHGLLCAIISGPSIVATQAWLPLILGNEKQFHSLEEIQQLVQLVMRLNNEIATALLDEDVFIPLVDYQSLTSFASDLFNEEHQRHLQSWCEGYLQGVALDAKNWMEGGEEVSLFLLPFYTLSKSPDCSPPDFPVAQKPTAEELVDFRESAIDHLPALIVTIYDFWREEPISEARYKPEALHRTSKIGRNAPCPCGSGKKFKKCCYRETRH